MRTVVRSRTYYRQLQALLDKGAERFGVDVALSKLARLDYVIDRFLAFHPRAKRRNRRLGLVVYPISQTPFVVLYDFDDTELKVHFVFLAGAGLRDLDPSSAEW